jgi:glycosyltransferase involved in cell wall biosynthesis
MHVCLISNQIAAWGKIGGFGTATRALGAGLVKRGYNVSAVVPRRAHCGQGLIEQLDGITVHGMSARATLSSGKIFRQINADIYHSQEPTIASWFAQRACPEARHVVTCRDPRDLTQHLVELRHTNYKRRLIFPATWWYEASPLVANAVRQANAVFCPAEGIIPRAKNLYGEDLSYEFVPSPVELPDGALNKADHPTVLFVGRWDHRKRIERFFQLAERNPSIDFIAVGQAHDRVYDEQLRSSYGHLPNLNMPGFVPRFGPHNLFSLYEKAWILVNTSAREGLPYSFIEAAAWQCAILSELDPGGFASRFGYCVTDGDYHAGLSWLLQNNRWQQRGLIGAEFVAQRWSEKVSLDHHLRRYQELLACA